METYDELKARYERLNQLHQVSQLIHSSLDSRVALGLIASEAARLMRASSASVVLINPTTDFLEIQASHGLPPNAMLLQLRLGEGITGWVARTGKPARVGNVLKDPRYIGLRLDVRSELAVPLEIQGEVRGALNVDSEREDAFSLEDEMLLQDLAVQAAGVIQNTWLYEQLHLKARLFEALISVSQAINSAVGLKDALQVIVREACTLMGAKMCSLLLLDETRQWLDLRACHGAGPSYIAKPRLSVEDSLVGIVIRRKKPIKVDNVQISNRYQNIEIARQEGLVALMSVPLVYNKTAMGALSVYTGELHRFSNEEIGILSALASLSAVAIEKAQLYENLVDMEDHLRQSEKLSALGLLAAEVAHEIRNPLTVIKMLFHSLDLRFSEEDPRSEDVRIIIEKMDRLNKIVEQALDFARDNEPRWGAVNINRILQDLRLLVRHKFAQQKAVIEFEPDPKLPELIGDAGQLEQAFLNLTLNSLQAMPNGGSLAITTKTLHSRKSNPDSGVVQIEFQDTGEGMTEEQQKRVFTSLLQTSKPQGTGLGLAIVAKIIESHHGQIKVFSRHGKGCVFRIRLPIQTAAKTEETPG